MTDRPCPSEHELLPLVAGESPDTELREHVTSCPACARRVEELTQEIHDLRSLPLGRPGEDAERPPRPATIGKYLVIGCLGESGQSTVYRAVHPTLEKEVVIKLGKPAAASAADQRHLLIAEGKHLARLDHPNLVRVYDLDFHGETPFLAMEYVRGPSLWEYSSSDRLSARRAAEVTAEVARALEDAHRHGILHQDVKPQNILVDEDGRARLIDFGLARLRHAWDAGGEDVSGGTPAFMAPEQARGEGNRLGPRSDLFSLAGVLYWLLTGKVPFGGDTPDRTLALAARCDFDRSALGAAPSRLKAICLKAMAEDPAQRYATAAEMAGVLEQFARRPLVLRRTLLVAGAALLAGGGLWLWSRKTSPPPAPALPPALSLEVHVTRGEAFFPLSPEAVPLNTAEDQLQIVGKVPHGWRANLYNLDAVGKVKCLPAEASDADDFRRLVHPGGGHLATLDPELRGTELLLLVAARSDDRFDGVERLIESTLRDLPELPAGQVIWVDRNEPSQETTSHRSPIGRAVPNPVAEVKARLDRLRQALRGQGLHFHGVAFSHR